MVDKVLKLLLLLSPIAYTTGMDLGIFDLIFFRLGAVVLFCASLFDKPKRIINLAVPITLVLGLCVLNLFGHSFHPVILSYTINVFLGLISLLVIVTYASPLKEFTRWIVLSSLINIGALIMQKFGFNPFFKVNPEEGGLMGNAPRLASYLTIVSPVLFGYSLIFIPLIFLIALVLKECTLLGVGLVYLFIKVKNKIFRLSIIGILVFSIFALYNQITFSLFNIRWLVWKPTLAMIFNHPLNGWGLGMFSTLSNQFINSRGYHVEFISNSYIEFIFGAGLMGLALICLGLRKFFKHFNLSPECLSILCLLILSCLEYPMEIPKLWFTIIALAGFFIIKTKEASC